MPRQLFLLFSWLCLAPIAPAEEGPGKALRLSPGQEALGDPGVPPLHEVVKEAVGKESGLRLVLAKPSRPRGEVAEHRAASPSQGPAAHDWLRDAGPDSRFHLLAGGDGTLFDHATLTIWNWDNEPIRQVRVEAGIREVALRIDGLGSYLLTLDGFAEGVCRKRLVRNIAATEDLNAARDTFRTDEFFLGVCAFPGRYHWMSEGEPVLPSDLTEQEARDLEAGLLARLGFQVVRVDESMEMGPASPDGSASTAGPYRFDFERMDAAVGAYTSRGFELALQTMNAPDWAIHPAHAEVEEHRWRYPREEAAQRAYVAALLERYGRHARFVQVFNEPDQAEFWAGTPAEFVEQFRYTHEQIRAWSSDIPVANGGYAFADEKRVRYFVERLRPWIDRPSYHSHGTLAGMRDTFAKMKSLHREAGYRAPAAGAPVFLNTETGFDAWRLDQERRQAQALVQKTLYGWANDHGGVMLFCGRMVKGPGREQRDLGLLDYEFCPRFAYAAVGGLVSVLAGATFETTLMQTEETCVYEFRRGADRIVAAFSLDGNGEIELRSDGRGATVVDAMGNRAEPAAADSLVLSLDGYPGYAIFEGATSVSLRR
ncbi:MAG: hypothetical protein WD342_12630 [Verrucomicrobiales bacterium]